MVSRAVTAAGAAASAVEAEVHAENIESARDRKAPPSWRLFKWYVAHLPKLNGRQAKFLSVLLAHADFNAGTCFLSWETIAREAGMSIATVARAQAELEAQGLLSHRRTWRGPRQGANRYRLNLERASQN